MTLLSVIAFCAIVFGVAVRFYWGYTRGSAHDTWYHLYIADRIRREKRLPERVEQFLVPGPYDYPPGIHLLLASVPRKIALRFNWLLAPVVETLHILLLIGVTYSLTQDVAVALVAGSIYATYSTLIVQFSALTPRVLGALLVSVLVLLVFYGVQTDLILPLVAAVLVGVVLLHTHKMSSQTVLFLFAFLSVLWVDPTYIGFVAAMVIVAVLASGGYYLTILRGHFNIIDFWRRQHRAGRPPGEFIRRYGHDVSDTDDAESPLSKLLVWVMHKEYHMVFADNAWSYLFAGVLAWGTFVEPGLYGDLPPFVDKLAVWALFIVGFGLLTQYVPYFKLVGEGWKYFMWGAFPTAVVLAVALPLSNVWVAAGFGIVLVANAAYGFVRMSLRVSGEKTSARNIRIDGSAVLEFLNEAEGTNAFPLPFGMSFHILYETDVNILFHQNPKLAAEAAFPLPIEPLADIADEFDIDYLVVDTQMVDITKFDTDSFEPVFEDADYLALEYQK